MPTPPTDPIYIAEICYYIAEFEGCSATWIHGELEKLRRNLSDDDTLSKAPSLRTVQRHVKELRDPENPSKLTKNKLFRFPEAMEKRWLPWESTRHCLDLLRWCLDNDYGRPNIRLTKWYWRVCLADPDNSLTVSNMFEEARKQNNREEIEQALAKAVTSEQASIRQRLLKAEQLSYSDLISELTTEEKPIPIEITEFELAYQPWRSPTDNEAFKNIVKNLEVKPVHIPGRLFYLLAGLPQFGRQAQPYL